MEQTKEKYNGLKTERITVRSASLLDASRVNLKARKSNTEWQEERQDLTLGVDPGAGGAGSRMTHQWETDF